MIGSTDDDHELAVEELHRRLLEGLQTCGIAIADSLESACARDLERQLVCCIRDEVSVDIGEGDGDEGKGGAI